MFVKYVSVLRGYEVPTEWNLISECKIQQRMVHFLSSSHLHSPEGSMLFFVSISDTVVVITKNCSSKSPQYLTITGFP